MLRQVGFEEAKLGVESLDSVWAEILREAVASDSDGE